MMRILVPLVLLLALCLSAAVPGAAVAQGGDDPPTELWEEYPLDETAPASPPDAGQEERQVPPAGPANEADDGGGVPAPAVAAIALGLLALLAGAAALRARRKRRRAASAPEPEPAPSRPVAVPAPALVPPPVPAPAPAPPPVAGAPPAASAPATNGSSRAPALGYTIVAAPGEAERERLREEAKLIQAACQEHGLALGKLVRDLESQAGSELSRPGLSYVLARLDAKEYGCLVVTRLDRLTRSAANLGTLLRMLREREARLIVIDIGLDTGTADGRIAAEALVTVGGLDQRKIEERTRNGLEAARSGRRASGRPAVADRPSLKQRIVDMRASGMTLQAIADTLNREGVPTVRGGAEWRPSSVQAAAGYKRPNRSRAGK
jgi:DNA invertase Pin-like site-specific DNA recombinase